MFAAEQEFGSIHRPNVLAKHLTKYFFVGCEKTKKEFCELVKQQQFSGRCP